MQKFFQKVEAFSLKIINKAENAQISLGTWLISLFCIILLRNFLEIFSSHLRFFNTTSFPFVFFHSISFYIVVFLVFSLFLHIATGEKIEKITKASLFAAALLLLPPILDILFSGGKGVANSYYYLDPNFDIGSTNVILDTIKNGAYSPFSGFDSNILPHKHNFGIRIEVLLLMLMIIYYIFIKTKSGLRMLASFLFLQVILFFIASFPYWLSKISGISFFHNVSILNPNFSWDYILFAIYFIFAVILGIFWFRAYNKEKLYALLKNMRFFRAVQIIALFLFGLYIAKAANISLGFFDYLLIIVACISLLLYWIAVVLFNDLADEKGDTVNDPKRPLPSGKLTREETKKLAFIFLIASYVSAFVVSYTFFILILFRSCLSYLYSNNPFRLKRIPFLSTFILALAAFSTVLGGYLLSPGKMIDTFPPGLAALILVAFTLGFNAKDIKDYEGDKIDDIKTLPVLLGLERGKFFIGILSAICFLLVPIFFPKNLAILFPLSVISGLLSLLLLSREKHNELPLFFVYFSYAIIASLIIFKF